MPTYKGFTATIYDVQTSQPLEEYCPTINTATNVATAYIETRADQLFTIVLRDTYGAVSQGTAVFVDGVYVDNGLTGPGIASERRWFGKRIDHVYVRPFVFRTISTADNENNTRQSRGSDVGTISLVLRRCQIGGMAEDQTNRGCVPEDTDPQALGNVNSRDDYLAHRAEYEPPHPLPATLYHIQWIDSQDATPYIEFRFIYRSRDVLISKGILPPPTPAISLTDSSPKDKKKRSARTTTPKKRSYKTALIESFPPSSPTTIESSPPKGRSPKRPRTKKTSVLEASPMPIPSESYAIESDLNSPITVIHREHQQQPGSGIGVLPWVESQSANMDYSFDIVREVRELRDEVKRLREVQTSSLPPQNYQSANPYLALSRSSQSTTYPSVDTTTETWENCTNNAADPNGEEGAPTTEEQVVRE